MRMFQWLDFYCPGEGAVLRRRESAESNEFEHKDDVAQVGLQRMLLLTARRSTSVATALVREGKLSLCEGHTGSQQHLRDHYTLSHQSRC